MGKRGAINEEQHLTALRAMQIGGGFFLTSNDAGTGLLSVKDIGTIGHRYIQRFSGERQSFCHAIENLRAVTLLVDLVDTYKGIDLSLELKQEYRSSGKPIFVRLDSGDILDQVRYFLKETDRLGFTDPKRDCVIVEGIESLQEIAEIEEMIAFEFGEEAKKRVLYGAGGLLISDKTSRSDASSGFKLSEYADERGELRSTMKFSNSPDKISYPGKPQLTFVNGRRIVSQRGERLEGEALNLFEPLMMELPLIGETNIAEAHARARRTFALLPQNPSKAGTNWKEFKAKPSRRTVQMIEEVRAKYGM